MRASNIPRCCLLLVALVLTSAPTVTLRAQQRAVAPANMRAALENFNGRWQGSLKSFSTLTGASRRTSALEPSATKGSGGIREEIPDRFRERYEGWKREFLSTETGRQQWALYEQSAGFTLTINIARDNHHGATTGKFKWNDEGELVGATITLGAQIDEGYPDPVYYPVMNALSWRGVSEFGTARILAATKIAHEFGHVNRAAEMDGRLYQLQNQLMPLYKRIFLSNGHNTRDPRLMKMASQMGGTSVEIWEDREYWGEANAMLYLRDRISEKGYRCVLFARIRRTVEEYAEGYAERFRQIAEAEPSLCGWH
jgi:hypothetical protein